MVDRLKNIADWLVVFIEKKGAPFVIGFILGGIPSYIFFENSVEKKKEKDICENNREIDRKEFLHALKNKDEKYEELVEKYQNKEDSCVSQMKRTYEFFNDISDKEFKKIKYQTREDKKIIQGAKAAINEFKNINKNE